MKKKEFVYSCDNPECNYKAIEGEEQGFIFKEIKYDFGTYGGVVQNVFACSIKCVIPAIQGTSVSQN